MKRSRKTATLSKSLNQQLNSYALMASAAEVSIRALISPAKYLLPVGTALACVFVLSEAVEAKIVYTPANRRVYCIWSSGLCRGSVNVDLNHDKIPDFKVTTRFEHPGFTLAVDPVNKKNAVWAATTHSYGRSWAAALQSSAVIQSATNFRNGQNLSMYYYYYRGRTYGHGPWLSVQNRYLGLSFSIKGKVHYGWARLSTTGNLNKGPWAIITGYAYETIPGKSIITGKIHGPDVITLTEPGSLGHLAHGASAIPAWRTNP